MSEVYRANNGEAEGEGVGRGGVYDYGYGGEVERRRSGRECGKAKGRGEPRVGELRREDDEGREGEDASGGAGQRQATRPMGEV